MKWLDLDHLDRYWTLSGLKIPTICAASALFILLSSHSDNDVSTAALIHRRIAEFKDMEFGKTCSPVIDCGETSLRLCG